MLYLDDLKYMRLYKKKFYLPITEEDRKHGSAILLLTKDYKTSNFLMNYDLAINRAKSYISYYIEKDIMYTIQTETHKLQCEYTDNGAIPINEAASFVETTDITCWDNINENYVNDLYCKLGNSLIFFNENYEDKYLEEASNINRRYKTMLYNDRIRNNKTVLDLYSKTKEDNPWITRTYVRLDRYKALNLFVDLYYYNQAFLSRINLPVVKATDMYFEFIRRFIMDRRLSDAGYTRRTVFIPVDGWDDEPNSDTYDYRKNVNPISVLYKKIRLSNEDLKVFGDMDFIFIGKAGYFKFNPNNCDPMKDRAKFIKFIKTLQSNNPVIDDDDEPDNSSNGITTDIVNKIEDNMGIEVKTITSKSSTKAPQERKTKSSFSKPTKADIATATTSSIKEPSKVEEKPIKTAKISTQNKEIQKVHDIPSATVEPNINVPGKTKEGKAEKEERKEELKIQLVDKINDVAQNSVDADEAILKMDEDEYIKQILIDLQSEADENIKISSARASRMVAVQDDFMKQQVAGKSVSDMINNSNKAKELPEKALPIKSINEEWKHLKTINFEKEYDLNADIVKILNSFAENKAYPFVVLSVDIEDTSTSEDSVYTYTVKCEDYSGKRFILKFDIPKFRDGRFMRLRGNEKIFSIEMPLIPISKTDSGEVQIVSLYNKIFVFTNYTSAGNSNPFASKISKTLSKYTGKSITTILGDNTRICNKYELPIDYIDLASQYSSIKYFSKYLNESVTIYFNQDEIRKIPGVNIKNGIPVAMSSSGKIAYYNGKQNMTMCEYIATLLCEDEEFKKIYDAQSDPKKSTYSVAKIMNVLLPVIVVLAYNIGLTKALDLAAIKYEISDKKSKTQDEDSIRLKDGYINYKQTYTSMMLMNGLKVCDMEEISIKDINKKTTWLNVLDIFGSSSNSYNFGETSGRSRAADGLDNFKDLMFDPITIDICKDYGLPVEYNAALIYASNLLVDNKHTIHKDISTNRYRTNEVIAAQFYKAISNAYRLYAIQKKRGRGARAAISMKQSAVIDLILAQNTTSDLSIFQPLNEIESKNMISTKGVSGMNQERAYKIDKRGYDDSMLNIIAQSTGFSNTVGVNRQTTINPQIIGGRGYFKETGEDNMNVVNTLGITEALSPFMLTSDDPFRNDMTFVQTSKHSTPVDYSTPLLVTTGADAAMPYLCSDMFAFKAKQDGVVSEKTDTYMIIEYNNGTKDYVNLDEQTMKNSDGGFYIILQLKSDYNVGDKIKADSIVAYDKKSFSTRVGSTDPQVAYNVGCLTKVAIMSTEDGYEDSGVCSEWLSETMSSDIVVMKPITLPPMTNVLSIVKKHQKIIEGEPVLIFQNAFDEEDANILLKNLNNDDGDVSLIGRNVIKSKVTGEISDIKIYRTCELDEMSESLRKIVSAYESSVRKAKKIADTCTNDVHFDSTSKLPSTGKLKNVDGILIEIYMKYHDKLAPGDKCSSNANKNIIMNVYSDKDAAYTDFRPTEAIDLINSCSALDGRMITSVIKNGALNKCLIELQRSVCDIYGIPWKDLHQIKDDDLK